MKTCKEHHEASMVGSALLGSPRHCDGVLCRSISSVSVLWWICRRMFRCPSDGGGEATAIVTTTDTIADFAMEDSRGIHGGIGE